MKNPDNPSETVEKILHAATVLFSERGFPETSLRTITGLADVNLASVNYHFGSKKELIQAVFARFMNPFSQGIDRRLDEIAEREDGELDTEALLRIVFSSLLEMTDSLNEDPQRFMRLCALAYSQAQEHLRHFIVANYGETYRRFITLLRNSVGDGTDAEAFWRSYFSMGAAVFTLSAYEPILSILRADFGQDSTMDEVIALLIPAMVRILKAKP